MLITTTHVTVKRPVGSGDPYESASAPTVYAGVAAHISDPSGTDGHIGGAEERIDAIALLPNAVRLQRADLLVDNLTGRSYRVGTVTARTGLGLDHVKATLTSVVGGSNG